jgi:hypothetical protein
MGVLLNPRYYSSLFESIENVIFLEEKVALIKE